MPRATPSFLLTLWTSALEFEIGIAVPINRKDLDKLRPMMYQVRKAAKNPELEKLMLCMPPKGIDEIWIVKKSVELD